MQKASHQSGFTFAVDDVAVEAEPLPECRAHEGLRYMLGSKVESCFDYHGKVIRGQHYQPVLAAVYTAFSQHRPLVLTPDAIWITIAQGVAHHMAIHGERLRRKFVSHQGKLELRFECRGWVEGSPENPWPEAFASWSGQIREHVGAEIHDALLCDFSTSGPVERAASRVVMMDVFERYFRYVSRCICGIPSITLEGAPDDWRRLRDKAAALDVFDLDWWLAHLLPLCDQFHRASLGDVDLDHWRGICKLREAYGGDIINGWIAKLFPYLRSLGDEVCNRRNPIFETGEGFQTSGAPMGLSRVPFTWQDEATGRSRQMEALGGLVGVAQDPQTLALRPKVGWAVREARKFDTLLARLAAEHATFPGRRTGGDRLQPADLAQSYGRIEWDHYLPDDLAEFYHRTDGADLFGTGDAAACRIVPASAMEPLDWGEAPEEHFNSRGPDGRIWHRFAWLPGGGWLAINLDPERWMCHRKGVTGPQVHRGANAICRGAADTQGRPGENPVIALSFIELLERMLDQGNSPYWCNPQFVGYGDAERYTRRD